MMEFLELLRKHRININEPDSSLAILTSMNPNKYQHLIYDLYCSLPRVVEPSTHSVFSFVANSEMSGMAFPCAAMDCRLARAEELSQFAALYSDTVFIRNPLDAFAMGDRALHPFELLNIIKILSMYAPLVMSGNIMFCSGPAVVTHEHKKQLQARREESHRLLNSYKDQILSNFVHNIKVSIDRDNKQVDVIVEDSNGIYDHNVNVNYGYEPEFFKKYNDKTPIPAEDLKEWDYFSYLIDEVLFDLQVQNETVDQQGANYVTSRESDIYFLNTELSESERIRNLNLWNGVQHTVPFMRNADICDIVELREKEGEHFDTYRDAFKKAIGEVDSLKSEKEIKELVSDIIRPEINLIKRDIKNNSISLFKSSATDVVLSSCTISLAAFVGVLIGTDASATNSAAIAAGTGSVFGFKNFLSKYISKSDNDIARKSSMYFLWKANKE